METWLASDALSDGMKALIGGLIVGLLFGACAQSSRFCLRSACIEFWNGKLGPKVAVWLLVFGTSLTLVQLQLSNGDLVSDQIRQISAAGTLSGALIGGVMFGIGMILARGCASRLLVLSATGNLRALLTGLVVTVIAQASLSGIISPVREAISAWWIVGPSLRDLNQLLPTGAGIAFGLAILVLAVQRAYANKIGGTVIATSVLIGIAVAGGWAFTSSLAQVSFEPISVGSVTFTGPAADTLIAFITKPVLEPEFSLGLVPGVFLGSLFSALLRREFEIQTFNTETGMSRYLIGAALMGFGGMLAGGCAVGAGITGGSVFSLTAWVALASMWVGAGLTDRFLEAGKTGSGAAAASAS